MLQESENVSIFAARNESKFLVFERKVIRFANSNDCMFGITALYRKTEMPNDLDI